MRLSTALTPAKWTVGNRQMGSLRPPKRAIYDRDCQAHRNFTKWVILTHLCLSYTFIEYYASHKIITEAVGNNRLFCIKLELSGNQRKKLII